MKNFKDTNGLEGECVAPNLLGAHKGMLVPLGPGAEIVVDQFGKHSHTEQSWPDGQTYQFAVMALKLNNCNLQTTSMSSTTNI